MRKRPATYNVLIIEENSDNNQLIVAGAPLSIGYEQDFFPVMLCIILFLLYYSMHHYRISELLPWLIITLCRARMQNHSPNNFMLHMYMCIFLSYYKLLFSCLFSIRCYCWFWPNTGHIYCILPNSLCTDFFVTHRQDEIEQLKWQSRERGCIETPYTVYTQNTLSITFIITLSVLNGAQRSTLFIFIVGKYLVNTLLSHFMSVTQTKTLIISHSVSMC